MLRALDEARQNEFELCDLVTAYARAAHLSDAHSRLVDTELHRARDVIARCLRRGPAAALLHGDYCQLFLRCPSCASHFLLTKYY